MDFSARRSPVLARHGMVACSQPLASEIGLRFLQRGANAVEAAVAMGAAMAVLEPCSTGLGGDAFLLYFNPRTGGVEGLNGSGRAPAALSLAAFAEATRGSHELAPARHALTVTVPGAAAAWADAVDRWGSGAFSLADLLAPAVELAREGFPVAPVTAATWAGEVPALRAAAAAGLDDGTPFLLGGVEGGRAPRAGEVFSNADLARTLEELGRGGRSAFYGGGRISAAIAAAVQARGGVLSLADLAAHTSSSAEPVSVVYRGVRVWELPPNTQGLVALLALGTLAQLRHDSPGWFDAAGDEGEGGTPLARLRERHPTRYFHLLIEALRHAFSDARAVIADPDAPAPLPSTTSPPSTAELLAEPHARARFGAIDPLRAAANAEFGTPPAYMASDTISVRGRPGVRCRFPAPPSRSLAARSSKSSMPQAARAPSSTRITRASARASCRGAAGSASRTGVRGFRR